MASEKYFNALKWRSVASIYPFNFGWLPRI